MSGRVGEEVCRLEHFIIVSVEAAITVCGEGGKGRGMGRDGRKGGGGEGRGKA